MMPYLTTVPQLSVYFRHGYWCWSIHGEKGKILGGGGFESSEDAFADGRKYLRPRSDR